MLDTKAGASDSKDGPAVVAKTAFDALAADKDKVLPKLKNKVLGAIVGALPDTLAARAHRGMAKPGSAGWRRFGESSVLGLVAQASTLDRTIGFVGRVGAADLPPDCADRLRLSLLDTLGCAAGGLGEESVRRVRATAEESGGTGPCARRQRPCSPASAR